MKPAIERAAAEMRLRNSNEMLNRMLRSVAARLAARKLSPGEADQLRRQFWEARLRDKRIVRGEITALSSRSS